MPNDKISHWSYSSAKNIYRKGVDYAVAEKLGVISRKFGKSVDIGKLIHAHLLGGEQEFVVQKYDNFRTKEAREWRDSQTLPIISEEDFNLITTVADRIKSHKLASSLLIGEDTKPEVAMKAKIEGNEWIGFADSVKLENGNIAAIVDLKTTAQFDDFKYSARKMDYDLQAAVYTTMANDYAVPFYWVIAETVAPFRVGVAMATEEFKEMGYSKLEKICLAINEFNSREGENDRAKLNFNMNETIDDVMLIGDWSL